MRNVRRLFGRLAASATHRRDEDRLREELEEHLALQTAENVRHGLSPAEARRQAALKFGPMQAITEQCRDEQRLPLLDSFLQDLRYALRQLRKAPLFTLTATLSLAMGIGANAAVFTVIERVLLRPLPVSDPQELVYVTDERILEQHSPRFSYPFYERLRANTILDGVAARFSLAVTTTIDGQAARVSGELVSGSYFMVLGVGPQLGRLLTPDDDRTPGAHAVTVISDGFWRRRFASDPAVLGRNVQINKTTFTIVGVAAKDYWGTDVGSPTDIWLPMVMQREIGRDLLTAAGTNWVEIIGRLSSGMSLERAGEELSTYVERRAQEVAPQALSRRLILVPGEKGNSGVRRELGLALKLLFALTALALVLACVNVASLLAARSAAREKEIAVRLALGASRLRLRRQFLTETLVLAALGGMAGLVIAPWAARLLVASQSLQLGIDTSLDIRVFIFALVMSALTGLLVGQAPILASRKISLAQAFANATGRAPARAITPHDVIVTLQIATSLAMLISAALLVQTLRSLNSVDPGFRADNLLLVTLDPGTAGYEGTRLESFWRDTLTRVNQIRNVQSASLGRLVPLAPGGQRQTLTHPVSGERTREIDLNFVGPRYFRTLDIPLLRGREFDETDGSTSRPVVIVNERLAQMFWPGQDPIGKGLRLPGSGNPTAEVVGLVKDVKYRDLRADTGPMFYRPILQTTSTDAMTLHIRAANDPDELITALRSQMQTLDPNVPLFNVTTLENQLNASFGQTRQAAALTGVFGVLALLLSAIGVYGVTALAVTKRTRDIGIRMALGAQRPAIVRVIARRGIAIVFSGLSLGLLGSYAFTQTAEASLYGVTASDSATFVVMAALLAVVSLLGCYIPVRTATRLDAMSAIRYE